MKVIATYASSANRRPVLGTTQPSIQCVPGLFPEVQRAERDFGLLPPSSADVKDE